MLLCLKGILCIAFEIGTEDNRENGEESERTAL
jgi:hypothetical protein